MKKVLSYLLPLAIGAGLLYFVFNKVDLHEVFINFKNANYFYVFISFVLAFFSHILRAARWNLMLKPMGYKPSLMNSSIAVFIGYITNLVFPRAGEVARTISLQKSENVDMDKSLGAVIAERVIDVLVLLVLLLINLFLEYERVMQLFRDLNIQIGWILPVIAVIGLVGAFLFFKYKDRFFKSGLFAKIKDFIVGMKDGLMSVMKLEKPWLFVLQSFMIWILYFFVTFFICYALDAGNSLSVLAVFTVFVMGTIGMAVPTTGGIGSYHLLVSKIVMLYGLSEVDGVSLATFLHTMNGILLVIIFGVVALILSAVRQAK